SVAALYGASGTCSTFIFASPSSSVTTPLSEASANCLASARSDVYAGTGATGATGLISAGVTEPGFGAAGFGASGCLLVVTAKTFFLGGKSHKPLDNSDEMVTDSLRETHTMAEYFN